MNMWTGDRPRIVALVIAAALLVTCLVPPSEGHLFKKKKLKLLLHGALIGGAGAVGGALGFAIGKHHGHHHHHHSIWVDKHHHHPIWIVEDHGWHGGWDDGWHGGWW